MEYVIGGDPRVSSASHLPDPSISGGNLVFPYKRNDDSKTDTAQVVEWSTGLDSAHWTRIPVPSASSAAVTVVENGSDPDDVFVAIPLSNAPNGKLFARLRITQSP